MDMIQGYRVQVGFDGSTLRAVPAGKFSRIALTGDDSIEELVLSRDEIEDVRYSKPNNLIGKNGNLAIRTTDGKKYQLHFRAKSKREFEELYRRLTV